MSKKKLPNIKYQESGGGWGNPLLGYVFDSNKDVPQNKLPEFTKLVECCNLSETAKPSGQPPTDVSTFELKVEDGGSSVKLVGNMLQADDKLQSLIRFIKEHSREEILE
jgi:hypothetical protein